MKKNKCYSIVFPIWLLFLFPLTILLLFPVNFILDSILFCGLLLALKISSWKGIYTKTIAKVWGIGLLSCFVGAAFLLLIQFLGGIPFFYQHIIYPMVWNPFTDIFAFLCCLIAVILSGFFIYRWNKKYSFEKTILTDLEKKRLALFLAILTAPYFFFLPTSLFYEAPSYQNHVLEEQRGSYIGDNTAVGFILKNIESGAYYQDFSLKTTDQPYQIILRYKEMDIPNYYQMMEQDAAILFNLIPNLGEVIYQYRNTTYLFSYEELNQLYHGDLRKIKVEQVQNRYKEGPFLKKANYLGNLENQYDLFDESTLCGNEETILWEEAEIRYYVSCSEVDKLLLYDGKTSLTLKEALTKKWTSIESVKKTNLTIREEQKQ